MLVPLRGSFVHYVVGDFRRLNDQLRPCPVCCTGPAPHFGHDCDMQLIETEAGHRLWYCHGPGCDSGCGFAYPADWAPERGRQLAMQRKEWLRQNPPAIQLQQIEVTT